MKPTIKTFLFCFIILLGLLICFNITNASFSQSLRNTAGYTNAYNQEVPLETYAATAIQAVLTFVGIIFVILLIYGGYLYMTAMGAEEKIGKSKKTMIAAVIGLIIIISGYSITLFLVALVEEPGSGMMPDFEEQCEYESTNYDSVYCCEYRYQVYESVTIPCCGQSSFCNNHPQQCTGLLNQSCP